MVLGIEECLPASRRGRRSLSRWSDGEDIARARPSQPVKGSGYKLISRIADDVHDERQECEHTEKRFSSNFSNRMSEFSFCPTLPWRSSNFLQGKNGKTLFLWPLALSPGPFMSGAPHRKAVFDWRRKLMKYILNLLSSRGGSFSQTLHVFSGPSQSLISEDKQF